MIPPGFMWKTNDGRVLDIRWMDSVHLVHSFNMLCRKHSLTSMSFLHSPPMSVHNILGNMADELKARGHFNWGGAQTPQYGQLVIPKTRESVQVLCMFRAAMDHEMPNIARAILHGSTTVDDYLIAKGPSWAPIITTYTAYRLERP